MVEEDTEAWQRCPRFSTLERVGGVDLSFIKGDEVNACAQLVVLSYPDLEVSADWLRPCPQLYNAFLTSGHSKCFTILPNIHPFMHTFAHRWRGQQCEATASSLGAVRVSCLSLGDSSTVS